MVSDPDSNFLLSYHFIEDEMGRACSTNMGRRGVGYWWENQKVRDHW
jgi:hypothetical protein